MGRQKGLKLLNITNMGLFHDLVQANDSLARIEVGPDNELLFEGTFGGCCCRHYEPEYSIKFTFRGGVSYLDVVYTLHEAANALTPEDRRFPEIDRVVFNGPATVTFFKDGTKVVSKCHDGDEFDPIVGLINACIRKLTKNHGHAIDAWGDVPKLIADSLGGPDDFAFMSDVLAMVANALSNDGIHEAVLEKASHEEPDAAPDEPSADELPDGCLTACTQAFVTVEELEREHERIRAEIRDLIDRGEFGGRDE